jgi:GTP pyrophosphokinase
MKMRKQNVGFHNLHDIMAFRIVTKDVGECYRILGVINSTFNMIPGTFRDYISTPKENGYQSLHMAILGPFNKKIEIQIRDHRMHEISELGVAAHWRYKEKVKTSDKTKHENEQYRWIRDLINLFENSESATEVLKNHKLQMHKNEVFSFTPNGDIFNLPAGSTVIDFAYAVHSQVGNNCISAKINGMTVPLRQKLENGDQVEIITSKKTKPSPNWLQFAATSKARSSIKNFIRSEKFEEYSSLGRAILNKFFASKNLELNDKILEKILPIFHKKTVADLCVKIAEGIISRQDVLKATYPEFQEEIKQSKITKQFSEKRKNSNYSLPIEGLVAGMAMHYGGCCNPIPGDPIVGVINTGTGVTIHSQTCRNLKNIVLTPQRVLDVCWKNDEELGDELYACRVRVVVENKLGSLADISSLLAKKKVNITNIKTTNRSADFFELMIDIEIKSVDQLEQILSVLRTSKKIADVERVTG